MAKKFYCSICGIELTHMRKAIPGKGVILDLIEPHSCDGKAIESGQFDSPTVKDLLNNLKPIGTAVKVSRGKESTGSTFDHQDRRDGVRSSAPRSLLDHIKANQIPGDDDA